MKSVLKSWPRMGTVMRRVAFASRKVAAGTSPTIGRRRLLLRPQVVAEDGAAVDRQQLSAQVAFMERKISKLREKLKRHANEAGIDSVVPPAPRDQLVAELEMLRSEVSRLTVEAKGAQARSQAAAGGIQEDELELLQARVTDAQARIAALRADTEAAEASADLSRRLVASVETRLQSVVSGRENEQAELIVEQRKLQRRLEEQTVTLADLEQARTHQRQLEGLRVSLAECRSEIEIEREAVMKAEAARPSGQEMEKSNTEQLAEAASVALSPLASKKRQSQFEVAATSSAVRLPPPEDFMLRQRSASPGARSTAFMSADVIIPSRGLGPRGSMLDEVDRSDLKEDDEVDVQIRMQCHRATQERRAAEEALQERAQQLQAGAKLATARAEELKAHILKTRADSEATLHRLEDSHRRDIEVLKQLHEAAVLHATEESASLERNRLSLLRVGREALQQQHVSALDALRSEASSKEAELAAQASALDFELAQARGDAELLRQEREFRGAAWIVLKRAGFDRRQALAVICSACSVPETRIRIVDDDTPSMEVGCPERGTRQKVSYKSALPLVDSQQPEQEEMETEKSAAGAAEAAATPEGGLIVPTAPKAPLRGVRPMRRRTYRKAADQPEPPKTEEPAHPLALERVEEGEADKTVVTTLAATEDQGSAMQLEEAANAPAAADELENELDSTAHRRLISAIRKGQPIPADERCLHIEFLGDPGADSPPESAAALAERLVQAVATGEPELQQLAVLSAVAARGQERPATNWPSETAGLVDRRVRDIRGWQMVVSVFYNLDPFVLKIVAFDGEAGCEFVLHLDDKDVEALIPGMPPASRRPRDMIEDLAPLLRIINRDGRLLLIASQQSQAPASVSNGQDPTFAERARLAVEYRRQQRRLVIRPAPPTPPQLALPRHPQPESGNLALALPAPGVAAIPDESWTRVYEDVLLFEDRFVLLWIETMERRGQQAGGWGVLTGERAVRLTFQMAEHCQPYHVVLPGDLHERNQRILAQHCELMGFPVVLVVEEMISPSLLAVLVLPAAGFGNGSQCSLCFSTTDWTLVDPKQVLQLPVQRHAQLLEFLLHAPDNTRISVEGLGAASTLATKGQDSHLCKRVAFEAGLTCCESVQGQQQQAKKDTGIAERMTHASSERFLSAPPRGLTGWTFTVQGTRKMLRHGRARHFITRVYHRRDPYSQFLLAVYQTRTCEEWELLVSEEDLVALPFVKSRLSQDSMREGGVPDQVHSVGRLLLETFVFADLDGQSLLSVPCSLAEGKQASEPAALEVRAFTTQKRQPEESFDADSKALVLAPEGGLDQLCQEASMVGATMAALPAACSGVMYIGGRFVDASQSGKVPDEALRLHTAIRKLGDLDLVLSIAALKTGDGHKLSVYHPLSCTGFELACRTRDGSCPEKFIVAHAVIGDAPLVIALAETSFPHAIHALVRAGPGKEWKCTVRDDDTFALLPVWQRKLMWLCTDEILKFGVVGEKGRASAEFEETGAAGVVQLSHTCVKVVRASLSLQRAGSDDPLSASSASVDKGLAQSCCTAAFEVAGRGFRLALARSRASGDYTIGICESETAAVHLVNICNQDLGLFSEFIEVAGLSFVLTVLLDKSPRCLRIAVTETASQKAFQLAVLDASESDSPLDATPSLDTARQAILDAHVEGFSDKPSEAMTLLSLGVPNTSLAESRPNTAGQLASQLQDSLLVHRGVRKLPSGQPVVISIIREVLPDTTMRYRVLLYHPLTAQEIYVFLVNPHLDGVLQTVGLGSTLTTSVQVLDEHKDEIVTQILSLLYVQPEGTEIELRPPRTMATTHTGINNPGGN
eukprot:TRINITY_DN38154_c0_g1_i3.p1 TRINITY_DN38154_c0_g1~~TRINITY_DN38154_c0_g1_i3.p1  ORF type:complete len:1818 (+),score=353.11 TRINITY_DN38154_c0_g1_i3:240-5693(+)